MQLREKESRCEEERSQCIEVRLVDSTNALLMYENSQILLQHLKLSMHLHCCLILPSANSASKSLPSLLFDVKYYCSSMEL
jgi:hypothetical protein